MWKKLMKELNLTDSYISMGLGLLVVLVVGVLLFNYFSKGSNPSISETGEQTEEQTTESENLANTHTVTEGETLWTISEKYYKSGYNWIDIAKANNLENANNIEVGQSLSIPQVTPIVAQADQPSQPTTTPKNYTVKTGDSLWNVAVEVYNDGYRWLDIAKANNLDNPDVIHVGNVLVIPR